MMRVVKHPLFVGALGIIIGTTAAFSSLDFNSEVSATELVQYKLSHASEEGDRGPGPVNDAPGSSAPPFSAQPGDERRESFTPHFEDHGQDPAQFNGNPAQPQFIGSPQQGKDAQEFQPFNPRERQGGPLSPEDKQNQPFSSGPQPGNDRGPVFMGPPPENGEASNRPTTGDGKMPPFPNESSQERQQFNDRFANQFQQQDEQQNAAQLAHMKQGIKQFAQGIAQFEKQITNAQKKGLTIPSDMTDAVNSAKDIINTVQNAQSLDDVLDAPMDEMQDIMQTLQDGSRNLQALMMFPKIKKEIDTQLKSLARRTLSAQKSAARAKIDVTTLLSEIDTEMKTVKDLRAQFEEQAKAGDNLDDAFSTLDDMKNAMDDLQQKVGVVEATVNASRTLRDMNTTVKSFTRAIGTLKKKKLDITDAASALEEFQSKIIELKSLIVSDFDPETFYDTTESVFEAKDAVQEAINALTGKDGVLKYAPGVTNPSSFRTPDGFDMFLQGPMTPPDAPQPPAPPTESASTTPAR